MIYKKDPTQAMLFSRYRDLLSDAALRQLSDGWQGVFRRTILALLPVECVEENFSEITGRPTKELYSICGLLLIMEYFKWSMETACLNYMVDLGTQFALNIERDREKLSKRTLYRYIKLLREENFAQKAMTLVTSKLIEELQINITEQRLDSTHVCSNMSAWSRKQLLHKVTQRFLRQVKRHAEAVYQSLDAELVKRYERNDGWIFGETSPMKLNRGGKVYTTEEQIGYDMEKLMARFSGDTAFTNMSSYKDLVQVFEEQFVIHDGKAELNAHPGGKVLLNPSDREAEIGAKGSGYQVQIAETCSENNDVQIITAAIPQGGSVSDMTSLPEVVDKLETENHIPKKLFADAGYGSDDNYVQMEEKEIELVAPAPHQPKNKVGMDECKFDEKKRIIECPAGNRPIFKDFKNGKGRAVFHLNVCENCPLHERCRSQKTGKQNRVFKYEESDLRSLHRREQEKTAEFKAEYGKKRVPIEGLNGRLKQFSQLRRLRIRGKPAVFHSIFMILIMQNIMQTARCCKIRRKNGVGGIIFAFLRWMTTFKIKKDSLFAA